MIINKLKEWNYNKKILVIYKKPIPWLILNIYKKNI